MRQQIRTTLEADRDIEICGEAENGREAVRKALELRPDLVLVDLKMPLMNGLQATKGIKMLMPNLPVLVFTLYDFHQIRIESEKAGADAFVPKADAGVQLSRTIRSLAHGH
jgi:DNA-binding NarL/FixJ family response regulator